jgi:hypothetical protein
MATIDLGKLGFVNKGTYNNSTTYEKNDLVQFTDGGLLSTYLYIDSTAQSGQAPSSSGTAGSRWVFFAKGGAAGTDVAATLANKEISFKTNAGALDGIPIGSAGTFLKVNSGATGYEFGAVTSGIVQFKTNHASSSVSQATTASGSFQDVGLGMSVTITPTSTSNKILIFAQGATQAQSGRTRFTINKAGDSSGNGDLHAQLNASADSVSNIETNSPDGNDFISMFFLDDNINSTNALTYKLRFSTDGGDTHFGVAASVPVMYAIELDSGVL